MASSPLYGDRPTFQGARRSITPASRALSFHEKAGLDRSDANEEVLYSHPNVKIFSFAPPPDLIKSTSKDKPTFDTDYPVDAIESLPWRSRTEIMIAAASMTIEKVRGSAIFLKCQDISQPILKNSQCWCVDGQSKFVLRVKSYKYNRIELPSETEVDKQRVEELKKVLAKVMRFEITPCPFTRGFSVNLPDDAMTPRRRGTWKREDNSQFDGSDSETPTRSPLSGGHFSGSRNPPSSYPRNGPNYGGSPLISSPSDIARTTRRDSLPRNDATHSIANGMHNDDADSGPEAEHRDVSHDTVGLDEGRGRPQMARKVSASIPVSVRIASIERSGDKTVRTPLSEKKPLLVNTNLEQHAKLADQSAVTSVEPETSVQDVGTSYTEQDGLLSDQTHEELHQEGMNGQAEIPVTQSSSRPVTSTDVVIVTDVFPNQAAHQDDEQSIPMPMSADETETVTAHTEILESVSTRNIDLLEQEASTEEHTGVPISDGRSLEASPEQQSIQDPPTQEAIEEVITVTTKNDDANAVSSQSGTEPSLNLTHEAGDRSDVITDLPSETAMPQEVSEAPKLPDDVTSTVDSNGPLVSESQSSEDALDTDNGDDAVSIASSTDSFHTMISAVDEIDHIPSEFDDDRTPLARKLDPFSRPDLQHRREMSELTITAASSSSTSDHIFSEVEETEINARSINPSTRDLQIPEEIVQELNSGVRQRLRARRSFSPMPPANTIVMQPPPTRIRDREIVRTVLQIVIIKPLELAFLLFHVARHIRHGATLQDLLNGDITRRPVQNRQQRDQARLRAIDGHRNGVENNNRRQDNTRPSVDVIENRTHDNRLNSNNNDNNNAINNAVANDDEEEDDYGNRIRGRTRHSSSQSQRPPNPVE